MGVRDRGGRLVDGINPFDQPDVEDAKVLAREITDRYDDTGALASLTPFVEKEGLRLYADDTDRAELMRWPASGDADVPAYVAHISLAPEPATTWRCSPTSR